MKTLYGLYVLVSALVLLPGIAGGVEQGSIELGAGIIASLIILAGLLIGERVVIGRD